MRYLRKFTGDDITQDDLLPPLLDVDVPIPGIRKKVTAKVTLDDLPIRVKTVRKSRNLSSGRRVVSAPVFDLVTPRQHLPQSNSFMLPSKRQDHEIPIKHRSLPPLPSLNNNQNKNRNTNILPSNKAQLPSIGSTLNHDINHNTIPTKQVQLPLNVYSNHLNSKVHESQDSFNSTYTNIIQIYHDNAPFGSQMEVIDEKSIDSSISNISDCISSADSDSGSSISSGVNSSLEDLIQISAELRRASFPYSPLKNHPRDSIRTMRQYDIKQEKPSRTNETDTSIYTRKQRKPPQYHTSLVN